MQVRFILYYLNYCKFIEFLILNFFFLKLKENFFDFFEKFFPSWSFQAILNATLSVDTFFVISGFLATYLFLNELKKKSRLSPKMIFMYFVHRFWRLTPLLGVFILFTLTFGYFLINGPGFTLNKESVSQENCKKYWWRPMLYIMNLFPNYYAVSFIK